MKGNASVDIDPILDFLPCVTPQAWVDWALEHPHTLLVDHANCEKKAASTALNLMYRYVDQHLLLNKLSRLAREELLSRHGRRSRVRPAMYPTHLPSRRSVL